MPAPHPLAALWATPEPLRTAARAMVASQIRTALALHGGDVRATAASLDPPVHETTLHDWITRWGLDDARQGREREAPKEPAKKKSRRARKSP